ncbi:TerD family protein [Streptomyces sp. NPDC049577]|uniref:TerD family protein n=1 Tax=Streptomyces sp. NPDC049577 TaxID=3155153 RepID=UPI003439767B
MTAELVRGQNHPLSESRLEIRVTADRPMVAGATLGDEDGRISDAQGVAHPAAPRLPGLEVSRQAAAEHRLAVDLEALPDAVHRVHVLLALPSGTGGPASFGATAAPHLVVTGLDGAELVSYTVTGLGAESAVVALELYRRQSAWKVRAVGQGYAGGLAALLHDQGLGAAGELAAEIERAVASGLARAVAPAPERRAADENAARRLATAGGTPAGRPVAGDAPAGRTAAETPAQEPAGQDAAQDPAQDPVPAARQPSAGPISYQHPGRRPTPATPATPGGPAATDAPSAPEGPSGPVAGDATGWSMEERLYNQVWGMFEDLARSAAAYRSAVDFAESRFEQELDRVLSDPGTRVGPAADAVRQGARAKRAELVDQARAALDRDLAQLVAEAEVVEHALPPAYARWDSPVWHGYQIPLETPMALRLGDLHLPERTDLRIPMLVRLPLQRGLWIDSGRAGLGREAAVPDSTELRRLAVECAVAHAVRLLAVHPVGDYGLHVIDPAGSAGAALAPLLEPGALREPPAAGARGVTETLEQLTRRVDLVQMAVRNGALDSLPPDLDTAQQLLVVNDFPHGFDDRSVTQLRYLADEGPSVGVHLMMVADREDARAYGPVLDPLWRALLRVTPVPDDHLADPWVGHAWTYEPALVPAGSEVLRQVLRQVGQARRAYGI